MATVCAALAIQRALGELRARNAGSGEPELAVRRLPPFFTLALSDRTVTGPNARGDWLLSPGPRRKRGGLGQFLELVAIGDPIVVNNVHQRSRQVVGHVAIRNETEAGRITPPPTRATAPRLAPLG